MFDFLKGSIRELKHVVWPTKEETQKYFIIVTSVLIVFGLYLFIASNLFSSAVFFLKDNFGVSSTQTNTPDFDLGDIKINTGAISDTGTTESSGNLIETGTIVE